MIFSLLISICCATQLNHITEPYDNYRKQHSIEKNDICGLPSTDPIFQDINEQKKFVVYGTNEIEVLFNPKISNFVPVYLQGKQQYVTLSCDEHGPMKAPCYSMMKIEYETAEGNSEFKFFINDPYGTLLYHLIKLHLTAFEPHIVKHNASESPPQNSEPS